MITIAETIRFIEKKYAWILIREPANDEECKIYEAVMTVLSTLEYSQLLTDKFGSLEEALEAEKVVHCWECGIWKRDETQGGMIGICNKPCEAMRYRCYDEYCTEGRYYKIADKKFIERIAEIADLFPRENIMPAKELKAALERYEKEKDE